MARYRASDSSERRTASLRAWVTPAEHKEVETAAALEGAALSEYVRECCLRRRGSAPVVAGTRRNPDAKALAMELQAIGNNVNQLARVANQTGEIRRAEQLDETLSDVKAAIAKVIAL